MSIESNNLKVFFLNIYIVIVLYKKLSSVDGGWGEGQSLEKQRASETLQR